MTFDPTAHKHWRRFTVTWFASLYPDDESEPHDYEVSREFVCDLATAMKIAEHGFEENAPATVKGASADRVSLKVHGDFPDPDVPEVAAYNSETALLGDLATGFPDVEWEWWNDPEATLARADVEEPRRTAGPVGEAEVLAV